MLAFQGEAEAAGAMVVLRTPVLSGRVRDDGFDLAIGGDEPTSIRCRSLVNAAGLYAPALARTIDGVPPETIPPAYFCRGVYFTLSGPRTVSAARLPRPGGGRARRPHHRSIWRARRGSARMWNGFPRSITRSIRRAARRSMPRFAPIGPSCADGALQPGYAGIRPKISGPAEPAADFVVQGPEIHGVPGLVNLYGIESPGLTASLPLADEVVRQLTLAPAEQSVLAGLSSRLC